MCSAAEIHEANQRFKDGDSLSDRDIEMLISIYKPLSHNLRLVGSEFGLACNEAIRRYHKLVDYQIARKKHD